MNRLVLYAGSALVALSITSSVYALNERDKRIGQEAIAQLYEGRVDSLTAVLVATRVDVDDARAQTALATGELAQVRATTDSTIAAARAERPTIITRTVEAAGPDSTVVREAVEAVAASYEVEISALTQASVAAAAVIARQADQIVAMGAQIGAHDALEASLRAQISALQGARASWTSTTIGRVAIGAGGLALGYAISEVSR